MQSDFLGFFFFSIVLLIKLLGLGNKNSACLPDFISQWKTRETYLSNFV